MSDQSFLQTFLHALKPNDHVLDLGAGEGHFASMFAERGAKVTAVDRTAPTLDDGTITFARMRVEDFVQENTSVRYDVVFMRNILQFCEKHWVFATLFPWLDRHVKQGGIVGIETFHQEPQPPFDHPMRSLYSLQELEAYFLQWRELYAKEYEHDGPDMAGMMRNFFVTDLIVQKGQ